MKSIEARYLERQLIEKYIQTGREVVENAPKQPRLTLFGLESRERLADISFQLVATLSSLTDGFYSTKKFIDTKTDVNFNSLYRILYNHKDEYIGCNQKLITHYIDECERVANEELGTLEDLKKEYDVINN